MSRYRSSRLRLFITSLMIVAMLLPGAEVFVPHVAQAQADIPAPANDPATPTVVPTPIPAADWPEAPTTQNQPYLPTFDPFPPPESTLVDQRVTAATDQSVTPYIDTESNKRGVVAGRATATVNAQSGEAPLGALQLSVAYDQRVGAAAVDALAVQAEVLAQEEAAALSPVGMAFRLTVTDPNRMQASAAGQPLQLTLDYSEIPIRYGGSFQDRLTLYRVRPCDPNTYTAEEAAGTPMADEPCQSWEALSADNNTQQQQLIVDLAAIQPTTTLADEQAPASAEDVDTAAEQLFLPLIRGGTVTATGSVTVPVEATDPAATDPTEELFVLAASASGEEGTYSATPFANVSDYQVSLATGAAQTSYPIPLPPAKAGLAPNLSLSYDSGTVDGMHQRRNNQPGPVGIGWSLESGYITRHLKGCNVSQAPGDLCLVGGWNSTTDAYSIVLNGVASRLVNVSGNLYRLQSDPYWKVEKFTNGATGHPDAQKEYWLVTTPDGTKYRFGGEFMPTNEGGADQNSVFYTTIYNYKTAVCGSYSYDLCNKAWQWNLDRVEDTNGNVISYFYELETNYYKARNDSRSAFRKQYVRAGNLVRIEYGRRAGVNATPPTQVLFNQEDRCIAPGTQCTWPTHFPDTPGDLECGAYPASCDENAPTFWSKQRLNYIKTQYHNGSSWVDVAHFELNHDFPTPPTDGQGDTSEQKLWLSSIVQKLGNGTGGLPAVSYGHTMLANRRNYDTATVSPMYMPRVNQITTELGGVINFTYGQSHPCPASPSTTIRPPYDCFVAWDSGDPDYSWDDGWVWWQKWKVTQQSLADSFSGSATQTYTYTYSTPTWHYSADPTLPEANSCSGCPTKHWNDFRGSELVTVTDATGAKSEHRFHRGMHNDRNNISGGTFSANITLSDSTTRTDENWLRGREVESRRLTSGSSAKNRSVNWFTSSLTAGSGINGAYFVGLQKNESTLYGTANKTTRTEYTYDSYGNVTREILHGDTATTADDRNVERSYLYNTSAWLVSAAQWEKLWAGTGSTGAVQGYTQYAYDSLSFGTAPTKGNLTKTRNYHTASNYYESSTTYDTHGRPTVVTDARNNSTTTAYHSTHGYVTSVTNDLSHVTSYVHDPGWGVETKITDPNGNVTELQYDGYGRLEKAWLPTEPKTGVASLEFVYDAAARPAWVKSRTLRSGSSYLESWAYVDGFGRDLQSQTPLPSGKRTLVSKQYNNLGQLAYQSSPYEANGAAGSGFSLITNWNTVANYHYLQYDELGNLWLDETKSTNSVLWSVTTIHDAWQKRVYDPRGNRTDYDHDGFGQLVTVTEYNTGGASYTTSYAYDRQGNLTQVTDDASNITSMTYDLLGRKLTMSDPDMGDWQYQYDAVGNLIAQRDARNQWLHLEYDDLNRITTKRRDTAGTGTLVASYVYDGTTGKGKLHSSTAYDNSGSTQVTNYYMTHDARGRLTYQAYTVTGIGSFRFDYTYHQDNQRKTMRYPGGNNWQQGETVTYGYNSVGQLTSVSGSGVSYVSAATYNAQGQITQLVNDTGSNGLTREWVYESNTLRLSTIRAGTTSPYTNRQQLTYAYDNNGNVTSLTDSINSGQKQCFQYDYLNRLTVAFTGNSGCTAFSGTGAGSYNHTYEYNAIGNLTNYKLTGTNNYYTYGDSNHKHAVTAAWGNTYGYDANGNQTSRTIGGTTYTFTYDYENRLTAISGGSTSATFVYDADGNRVKATVNGLIRVYLAGLYEYQGGATTKYYEGNAVRRTGYGSDNGVFYNLRDHLNSSSVITNQSGAVVSGGNQYFYPFGGNRGSTFTQITRKRFTGQYHEDALPGGEGLSYYNARWYDAKLGRFISADTIVPGPGNPQAFNRYAYVLNNPLKFIDPSGHEPCFSGNWGDCFPGSPASAVGRKTPSPNQSAPSPYVSQVYRHLHRSFRSHPISSDLYGGNWNLFYTDLGRAIVYSGGYGQGYYRDISKRMAITIEHRHGPMDTSIRIEDYFFFFFIHQDGILRSAFAQQHQQQASELQAIMGLALASKTFAAQFRPCSFSADTVVTTEDGFISIAEITENDHVLAYDEKTGKSNFYSVLAMMKHLDPIIVHVTIDEEVIETTPDHLFYTMETAPWLIVGTKVGRWIPAGELVSGKAVRQADGTVGYVKSVRTLEQSQMMYDLTVADVHTYFVGEGQWLVHNCPRPNQNFNRGADPWNRSGGQNWKQKPVKQDSLRSDLSPQEPAPELPWPPPKDTPIDPKQGRMATFLYTLRVFTTLFRFDGPD